MCRGMFVSCKAPTVHFGPLLLPLHRKGFHFPEAIWSRQLAIWVLTVFLLTLSGRIHTFYFILHLWKFHLTVLTSLGDTRLQAQDAPVWMMAVPLDCNIFWSLLSLNWRASPEYFCTETSITVVHLMWGFSSSASGTDVTEWRGIHFSDGALGVMWKVNLSGIAWNSSASLEDRISSIMNSSVSWGITVQIPPCVLFKRAVNKWFLINHLHA